MNLFRLTVSTPNGNAFDGEAVSVSLRGAEGELAVMAGHAPIVTTVKPCRCRITLEDESTLEADTDGGLLTVSSNSATLLTGSFRRSE